MKTPPAPRHPHSLRGPLHDTLALALLAGFGAAQAADDTGEAQAPVTTAAVSAGVGAASGDSGDRALFGQYNGLRRHGTVGLFGVEYSRFDPATGNVLSIQGTDLLLETRELGLRWKHPGDWKLGADYGELVHHDPLSSSTGPDLRTKRTRLGIAFAKVLGPRLQLDVNLSSENKDGSRLFGVGMSCPSAVAPGCGVSTGTQVGWGVLMVPEPIDSNHTQVEARLTYAIGELRINGGYYGSFYRNALGNLTPNVPSTLNSALGTPLPPSPGLAAILGQPLALPPDNQLHQVDVGGVYAFTPATRLNFKVSHSEATQHQGFVAAGFTGAPAGVNDLGGRIDTTLVQAALTSRPLPRLSLLAKVRWEDRDDKTPIALYNIEDTSTYTNRRMPLTRSRGQAQATWRFTSETSGTVGADYESIDRGVFTSSSAAAGISALRQETAETGVRAELRRRMSETLNGSVILSHSRRDGSNWLRDNSGVGVTEVPDSDPSLATAILMPTLADRRRDQVKLLADWQPLENLSLQFALQSGRDRFSTPSIYGLRDSDMDQLTIDANYALSSRWSLTGFVSHGSQTLRQARPAGVILDYDNRSTSLGLGVTGKPVAKLEVGGNFAWIDDRSIYAQTLEPAANAGAAALLAATGGLPDIVFRQSLWKFYGRYEVDKQSEIRVDLIHQRSHWNDWTWVYNGVPFTYSDGTVVGQQPRQIVTFVAVRYVYRWR
jgi:MtrB/PioB family decaheme-associated outer membrane protein